MTDKVADFTDGALEDAFTKATERLYVEDKKPSKDDIDYYRNLHEELHRRAKAKKLELANGN